MPGSVPSRADADGAAQAREAARCPLCGGPNACTIAAGRPGERCWCVDATITPAMLERLPAAARGVACLCAACVARLAREGGG